MDSYKVFQSICLALVLSWACADGKNEPCTLEKGYGEFRLAGDASDKGEGRAEVKCDGTWGTIFDENWDEDLTEAFCNELGFNGGKQVQVMNITIESNGPVLEMQCIGNEIPIKECNFTKREAVDEYAFGGDLLLDSYNFLFWDHTNDVMLKCFQPELADLSKSSVHRVKGQSNLGQDSQDAVVIKKTSSSNIAFLVVLDGIEFVLLLVAVVVTSFIVYRKATREMRKAALKDKRSPESQAMLDISQVTVQPTAPVEDPQEGQQWKSSGETVRHNPVYGMAEKY